MSIFNYRKKKQLYDQWVEKSGLPLNEVPKDTNESGVGGEMPSNFRLRGDNGGFYISTRYLLIAGVVLAFLLIIVTILATVLLMRSC